MADIAPGLNFRIGADVKGINKAIRDAEKSLRGAVSSFSSIGNSLSLALSAPLAIFGASAIKAAGDMESLRMALEGTMKDAGYSIEQAHAELEALRIAALAPGLDFEQAVRGSIRLQSVGKSAEEARGIIVQLANALTLSGGTADQLDGVTRQFTQMIGKGKLMQEDFTIILENMPALAKVMNDTFGSSNAEMLRDMGVSVEDFITGLTKGMEKLPRAQGGIANAIVNAQNAIKQALASTGEEINRVFNVTGALTAFAQWVSGLAAWFKGLDDETKRVIGKIVIFTATLGPALLVMGRLAAVFGNGYIALQGLSKGFATTGTIIGALSKQWAALNVITKASIFGALAAAVTAAAIAFATLKKDTSEAAESQRVINAEIRDVSKQTGIETAALNRNFEVLKDVNASQDQRRGAIKALQEQYPEYLGNLDLEKMSLGQLDVVQGRLNKSILESVAARKQATLVDEQFAKMADAKRRISDIERAGFDALTGEEVTRAGRSLFGTEFEKSFVMASARTATVSDVLKALRKDVESADAAIKQINTSFDAAFVTERPWQEDYYKEVEEGAKKSGEATGEFTDKTVKAKTALDTYLESVKKNEEAQKKWNDAREAMGVGPLETAKLPMADATSMGMTSAFSGLERAFDFAKVAASVKSISGEIVTAITPAKALMTALTLETFAFGEAFTLVAESMAANGTVFEQIGFGIVSAMDGMAEAGKGIEDMAGGILQSLKKIVGGLIKTGVAAVVTKALLASALNPFAALALGAASGALAQGLFNSLINKVKVPGLAEGGVLTGPRLVMAGEYPGAKFNPEIVTPENKMRDVFSEVMGRMGGAGGGTLTCRVDGESLLFVLDKATARAGRKR